MSKVEVVVCGIKCKEGTDILQSTRTLHRNPPISTVHMRLPGPIIFLLVLLAFSSAFLAWNRAQSLVNLGHASPEATISQLPVVAVSVMPSQVSTGESVYVSFFADVAVSYFSMDWGDGSRPDYAINITSGNMCGPADCALPVGVSIFAHGQDPVTIVNGSIIAFKPYLLQPEFLVVSRVIKIIPASQSGLNQITFWTKGDANAVIDVWDSNGGIPGSQVLGVYQSILNTPSIPHSYVSTGNSQSHYFTIEVNATDSASSTGYARSSVLVMDRPPTLTISGITPSPSNASQVALTFLASDPDGTISNFKIEWGDGSTPTILPGSATSAAHSYIRFVGEMQITVTVADNSGSTANQTTLYYVTGPLNAVAPYTILGLPPMIFYSIIGAWIAAAAISSTLVVVYRRRVL